MNIDFELYRSFVSIYKNSSVSEAAKTRYMTQPALSQHLLSLESIIGEPLFFRQPRKMVPTEKGKELYAKLIASIENLENLSWQLGDNNTSTIKIGTPVEYFSAVLLKKMTGSEINLNMQFGDAQQLLELLDKDAIDIMVATKHLPNKSLDYVKLYEERFVFVTNQEISNDVENVEKWLGEQKWISYSQELPIIRRFWRKHFNKRPLIFPTHIVPDLRVILSFVENGLGVSILPTYLIEKSLKNNHIFSPFPNMFVNNDLYIGYKIINKEKPLIKECLSILTANEI